MHCTPRSAITYRSERRKQEERVTAWSRLSALAPSPRDLTIMHLPPPPPDMLLPPVQSPAATIAAASTAAIRSPLLSTSPTQPPLQHLHTRQTVPCTHNCPNSSFRLKLRLPRCNVYWYCVIPAPRSFLHPISSVYGSSWTVLVHLRYIHDSVLPYSVLETLFDLCRACL